MYKIVRSGALSGGAVVRIVVGALITNALAAGPIEVADASSRFYPVDEIHPAKIP
jgi:hypothetical protein